MQFGCLSSTMSSARVFKPIYTDYALMRSSIVQDRRTLIKNVEKVKRVLFEPVDHEETRKFLQQERDKQSTNDMLKYGFDFVNGKPLSPDGSERRFEWYPVVESKRCFAPKRRRNEEVLEEDISDLYCETLNIIKPTPLRPEENVVDESGESPSDRKKQSRITDFMAIRKRTSDSAFAKKPTSVAAAAAGDPRPSKIPRSNNVAS